MLKLVSHPEAPALLLSLLSNHLDPDVAQTARLHVNLAGEADADWEQLAAKEIREIRPADPGAQELHDLLLLGGVHPQFEPLLARMTRQLAQAVTIRQRALAEQQHFSMERLLLDLAYDSDHEMRIWVALHPGTPQMLVEMLVRDKHVVVRQMIARNPALSPLLLAELALGEAMVRMEVAQNRATSSATLATLATDVDWQVRLRVARNPATPLAALEQLITDPQQPVWYAVIQRPDLPPAMIERLQISDNPIVRDEIGKHAMTHAVTPPDDSERFAALANHDLDGDGLARLAVDPNMFIRLLVANDRRTPSEVLEHLAHDPEVVVRAEVAFNPRTPWLALTHLAEHREWQRPITRVGVASNAATVNGMLAKLILDPEGAVRRAVLNNPNTPDILQPKLLEKTLERLNRTTLVPFAVALAHPDFSIHALRTGSESNYWLSRYALTLNPNVPNEFLTKLTTDSNRLVRAAAVARLQGKLVAEFDDS